MVSKKRRGSPQFPDAYKAESILFINSGATTRIISFHSFCDESTAPVPDRIKESGEKTYTQLVEVERKSPMATLPTFLCLPQCNLDLIDSQSVSIPKQNRKENVPIIDMSRSTSYIITWNEGTPLLVFQVLIYGPSWGQ